MKKERVKNKKTYVKEKVMKKKGLVRDFLIWILLGLAILVLMIFVYYIAAGKSFGFLAKIRNIFTFGT